MPRSKGSPESRPDRDDIQPILFAVTISVRAARAKRHYIKVLTETWIRTLYEMTFNLPDLDRNHIEAAASAKPTVRSAGVGGLHLIRAHSSCSC
jgi:hypothetical protein